MKNSYKKLFGGLFMLGAVCFAGCHQPDAEIDTLDYSRALQPLNFTAAVDRETGYDVNFSWTVAEKTDYVLSIQEVNEEGAAIGSPIEEEILAADAETPYKVTLTPERIYKATLQAFSATNPNLPGSLLVEAGPVETYYVMESLNPELVTRTMNSITVKWTNDDGDATQLSKIEAVPLDAASGAATGTVEIDAAARAAGAATVGNLTPSTQYVVTLYYSKSTRGGVTAWTAPDTEGMTLVKNSAELMQALTDGATKIAVKAGEKYVLEFSGTNPLSGWKGDLELVGVLGDDGSMPVIRGFELESWCGTDAANGATGIYRFENIVFEGTGVGDDEFLFRTGEGADAKVSIESVAVLNCELYNYVSGVVFTSSKTAEATIGTIRLEGLYIHDFLNAGGDLIDFRIGTVNTLTIRNNTIIDAGRAFLFSDVNANFSTIEISNNTLNRVGLTNTRKGIIGVRTAVPTFTLNKNLFLNEYSTSETVRLIHENANAQIPSMSGNYFYNICYNSTGDENYAGADFFTTKIGNNATAVNKDLCLSGGGKVLTSDPCVKSSRNKMELTNSEVAANEVGDPRWWTVAAPVTEIATELTPVTEDYAWPLSDDLIFEPQDITETIIYGNLRFIASNETFPVSITSDHTITFSGATTFTADGEPTNNALAIRVSEAGSLILTPSNAGIGVQLEIIAGTERYTVPCDGVEHTVGLGEITGDTHVYITTTGAVEFSSLAWSTEVSVDGDLKALATPVVKAEPASVAWSAEQEVVLSWEAVANAAAYAVTWGDQEPETVEEPTFTIPAATVKTLAIGSYPVTVVAQPVETSTKYKASAAGEAKFEVTKITLGTPEVSVAPSTVNVGTEQAVVVSWPAVANAASYDVTFNGQTMNQSETTLTLSAADVALLAAGRYEITVVAKPTDAEHYVDSAAGAGELEIKAVGAATTLSWNFSDAGFDAVATAIGTSDNKTYSGEWNGLNIAAGNKSIKIDTNANDPYTRGLRLGGEGSTTERVLSFTAPASGTVTVVTSATGSTTDEERNILVQAGSAEPESKMAIVRMSKELVTNTFDITVSAPTTIYVYADASINVYKIEFSYVEAVETAPYSLTLNYDLIKNKVGTDVQILTGTAMDGSPSADALEKFSGSSSTPFIQTWTYQGVTFGSTMAASSSSMYMKKGLSVETYLKNETSLGAISTIYLKMVEGSKLPAVNSSDDGSVFTTLDTPSAVEGEGTYAGYYKYDVSGKPYFKIMSTSAGDAKVIEAIIVGEK
ncbi:DUF4957 domain-containing protein [Alistipes sp. An66]|uniref:DUF4957 domain-containing protein n=1 Tax=Alistipes sp. An66 TaxID=1965650 RepID=UPI000B39D177|nr:DUF4957 domain-containing protein [Alistipes sp. An66]OUN58094.1 hypothetical protein B5G16_10195 [Alistipes sp. An66]